MQPLMNKVTTLTDELYDKIKKNEDLDIEIKNLLGISESKEVHVGDSMVHIGQFTSKNDVFKYVQKNGKDSFYIVITPVDEQMAFCYCIH